MMLPLGRNEIVTVKKELTVINKHGLHARPAMEWVRCAIGFRSAIFIWVNGRRFSGSQILDVLLAKLECGATFTLEVSGPDAEAAAARLKKLLTELRDADLREAVSHPEINAGNLLDERLACAV